MDRLLDALSAAIAEIMDGGDPDCIGRIWAQRYSALPVAVRAAAEQPIPVTDQGEFIERLRKKEGVAADWAVICLSVDQPFQGWTEWERAAQISGGPMVTENRQLMQGYRAPIRGFVLPAKKRADTRDHTADLAIWPYGVAVNVLPRIPALLCFTWLRNLLGFFVEPIPIALLTLTCVSLAGLLLWGSRSEAALRACLITGVASSLCLICLALLELLVEWALVSREGWLSIWKSSLIQVVGDPKQNLGVKGDSCGLAVVLAAFAALAERVQHQNKQPFVRSRFWKMMSRFPQERGRYAATGRIAGPFGLGIGRVGLTDLKRKAVDAAGLAEFLVPFTFADLRHKVREILNREEWNRARLRLRALVPATILKLGGTFRAVSVVAAALAVAVVLVPARGEYTLMSRIYPPRLQGAAHWWPRTGPGGVRSVLQLNFRGVPGDAADYFVIVEGNTAALKEDIVAGRATLSEGRPGSGSAHANVSLKATGSSPDPHRLSVVLFEERQLMGLRLPPVRVSTFGIPDITVERGVAP